MLRTPDSLTLVGSGNVAEAFARACRRAGIGLRQVYGRNAARTALVAEAGGCRAATDPADLEPTDLYIVAVSDKAVAEVAASLPAPEEALVVHTAGCVPIDALARFARRGVLYPFQTFTAGREVDFAPIPLFLETARPADYAPLESFARRLSANVRPADSRLRAEIHLAGVFACNFANHLFEEGLGVLRRAGLGYDALRPLIAETAAKALSAERPADVQTGPAVRGDRATQERHAALLAHRPALLELYRIISQQIWETSRKTS